MQYCLDTNVLIQAWNHYYSPELCADYWDCLGQLTDEGIIFITEEVFNEIKKEDDQLKGWIDGKSEKLVKLIDEDVQENMRKIFDIEENRRLVDSIKGRSIADPWVIAHAMALNATVVTKENLETNKTKRIKIPNVCLTMDVDCINDFEFIRRVGIRFNAAFNH